MKRKTNDEAHADGFRVQARSYPNPDFGETVPRGPDLDAIVRDPVCSVRVYLSWIRAHGLGGGNAGDGIVTVDGIPLARISYNGRMWHPGPRKTGDKPTREPTAEDFEASRDWRSVEACIEGGQKP